MNIVSLIAMAILLPTILVLVLGLIVLVFYLKTKKFIHKFILYDANDYPELYHARIINEKEQTEEKVYQLIPDLKVPTLLSAYFLKRGILLPKPNDRYIKKGRYGSHYIVGYFINNSFTPLEPANDGRLEAIIEQDNNRKITFIQTKKVIDSYIRPTKINLMLISIIFIFIMLIVALVFIGGWIENSASAIKEMSKNMGMSDLVNYLKERDNYFARQNELLLKALQNKPLLINTTELPPDLR